MYSLVNYCLPTKFIAYQGEFCSSVSRLGKKGGEHFGPQDSLLPLDCAWHLATAWEFGLRAVTWIPANISISR